jgi:zinc transporter ZupT
MATVLVAAILTALATGLGALPFLFVRRLSPYWVSIANATAGGLMFAATHSLVAEGVLLSPARLVAGMLLGLGGILAGRTLIGKRQHAAIADLSELDARKALLFIGVMTAHSFAEGVGVGVSFGGSDELAIFITAAIAVHNIPEGLAISLMLVPRGMPVRRPRGISLTSDGIRRTRPTFDPARIGHQAKAFATRLSKTMLAAIPTASAVGWSHLADERIAEFVSEDASFVAILTGA